jgi:hypothetical protein
MSQRGRCLPGVNHDADLCLSSAFDRHIFDMRVDNDGFDRGSGGLRFIPGV